MQFAFAVTAVLLAVFTPTVPTGDANADPGVTQCIHPTSVEKFAASFYTAMIVSNDPHIVDNLQVGSGEAGMIFYIETKNVLEEHRQCNAEEVAFIVGRAAANGGPLDLPTYFKNVAYSMGEVLYGLGLLDCDNATRLSLQCYGYVRHRMEGLDNHKFATYVHGIVYGWVDLQLALGLKLDEVAMESANMFLKESQPDKPKKCKFDTDSGEDSGKQ